MSFSRFNPGCCCDGCEWYSSTMGLASTSRPVDAYRIWRSSGTVEYRIERVVSYTGPTPYPNDAGYTDTVETTYDMTGSGEDTRLVLAKFYTPANNSTKHYPDGTDYTVTTTPRVDGPVGDRVEQVRYYYDVGDFEYDSAIVFKYSKGSEWSTTSINAFNGILGNNGAWKPDKEPIIPGTPPVKDITGDTGNIQTAQSCYLEESRPGVSWFDSDTGFGLLRYDTVTSSKAAYVHGKNVDGGPSGVDGIYGVAGGESGEFWIVIPPGNVDPGVEVTRYDAACTAWIKTRWNPPWTVFDIFGSSLAGDYTYYNLPTTQEYTYNPSTETYTSTKKVFDGMLLAVASYNNDASLYDEVNDYSTTFSDGLVSEYGFVDSEGTVLFSVKIEVEPRSASYNWPVDNVEEFSTALPGTASGVRPGITTGAYVYWPQIPAEYSTIQGSGDRWVQSRVKYTVTGGPDREAFTNWVFQKIGEFNVDYVNPPRIDLAYRDGSIFMYLYHVDSAYKAQAGTGFDAEAGGNPSEILVDSERPYTLNLRALDIDLTDAHWFVKTGDNYTIVDYLQVQKESDTVDCSTALFDGLEYPYSVPEIKAEVTNIPLDLQPVLDTKNNGSAPALGSVIKLRSELATAPFGFISGEQSGEFGLKALVEQGCNRNYPLLQPDFDFFLESTGYDRRGYQPYEYINETVRVTNNGYYTGALAWDANPWSVAIKREVVDQDEGTVTLDITATVEIFYQPVGIFRPDTAEVGGVLRAVVNGTPDAVLGGQVLNPTHINLADDPLDPVPLDTGGPWPPVTSNIGFTTPVADLGEEYIGYERPGNGSYIGYEVPDQTVTETCTINEELDEYPYGDTFINPNTVISRVSSIVESETIRVVVNRGQEEVLRFKPFEKYTSWSPLNNNNPAMPAILESEPAYGYYYEESISTEESLITGIETHVITSRRTDIGIEFLQPPFEEGLYGVINDNGGPPSKNFERNVSEFGNVGWHYSDFTQFTVEVTVDGDW